MDLELQKLNIISDLIDEIGNIKFMDGLPSIHNDLLNPHRYYLASSNTYSLRVVGFNSLDDVIDTLKLIKGVD